MKKEKWDKPKLIILTRGKPEEKVLSGCKYGPTTSGPTDSADACSELPYCDICSTDTGS